MYSTCLFCHSSLGTNEIIEHFPVGRRLAFDAAKGRLWVVCVRCTRWNLTPLEERWEAIEQCERVFRDTKLRVSTDNIGMARLREGLELIRVGRALRPEIVVWRYGAANQARRRRSLVITAVAGAAWCASYYTGLSATGPLMLAAMMVGPTLSEQLDKRLRRRHRPLVLPHKGQRLILTREQAVGAELVAKREDGWALRVDHRGGTVTIADETRLQRLAAIMASINDSGVSKRSVQRGERLLTEAASTERLIASHATPSALSEAKEVRLECPPDESPYYFHQKTVAERRRESAFWTRPVPPIAAPPSSIASLPEPVRAALEMAANEEAERRAMEGELAALEESWREAEEIASIADNLFLPESVNDTMRRLRGER
jgi:hypothetical protein